MPILPNPKFRFRSRELQLAQLKLRQGDSLLITGLRRIGKSWCIKQALSGITNADYAYLDVQKFSTPAELIQAIIEALPNERKKTLTYALEKLQGAPEKLINALKKHLKSAKAISLGVEFTEALEVDWQMLADSLSKLGNWSDAPFILALDEVPFFLENMLDKGYSVADCKLVLAFLRTWRDQGVRMIMGGSVSLENMLLAEGIPKSVLGGLDSLEIQPFAAEEMASWLDELAQERGMTWWNAAHNRRVCQTLCDHYPFFGKYAMDELAVTGSAEALSDCLQKFIVPGLYKDFLGQFDERLGQRYKAAEAKQARRILDAIARDGAINISALEAMVTDPAINVYSLRPKLLRDDFLRENHEQKLDFSLGLLRNYWRQRLGLRAISA